MDECGRVSVWEGVASCALPEQMQNQQSQALRAGRDLGVLEFICPRFLFTVGAPMPTSPQYGHPAVCWPLQGHRTGQLEKESLSSSSRHSSGKGLSSPGLKSVCLWLLLLVPTWIFCSSVHIFKILTRNLGFFIPDPVNKSSQRHPSTFSPIPIFQIGKFKFWELK